jgi:hypothetical protein
MELKEILEIAKKNSEKLMLAQVIFEEYGDSDDEIYSGAIDVLCDIYDDLSYIVEKNQGDLPVPKLTSKQIDDLQAMMASAVQ